MTKTTAILSVGLMLSAATVFGQATLPAFHSGSWSNAFLPTGWSQSGITDYGSNYDGVGLNAAKYSDANDRIQVFFSSAPSTVSYYIKANTLTAGYDFRVQESVNGTNWTDVSVFTSTNNPIPSTAAQYTNNLLSSSRYVRFIFMVDMGGGIGIDGVNVSGPSVPVVAFAPPGNQSIAASNQLTLATSITPAGSGLKSWTFLPSNYAGVATMSNGTFRFTPAVADVGNVYALAVVGSNSVGSTTGTVNVTVTAYVPPVPVVSFSPAGPYSIMATYTQKLGVGVAPAGSGIASWTFLPSNYAGSATLVGTNFTFSSAQADGPASYTLSIVATNGFGGKTGTAEVAVTEYVPPPPPGAYVCTFEDGTKAGYASADVTLSNKVWNLTGILIGTDASDLKIGTKAARLKYDPTDGEETMTVQSPLLENGISTISLWYGPYGTHGEEAPELAIEINSALESTGWIEVGAVDAGAVTELSYYSADVYVSQPAYVRIRAKNGVANRSGNFDNIAIGPYTPPTVAPYDAFLLKYNVTPGDPGTAAGEDLDGDFHSNTNEFIADTNPYDPAIHP